MVFRGVVLNVRDASGVLSPKLFQGNLFDDSKRLSVVYARTHYTHLCSRSNNTILFARTAVRLVRTRVSMLVRMICELL